MDPDPMPAMLTSIFRCNIGTADIAIVWDAAKAYLRGQFRRLFYQKCKEQR